MTNLTLVAQGVRTSDCRHECRPAEHERVLLNRERTLTKEKGKVEQRVAEAIERERVRIATEEAKKNANMAKREKALLNREEEVTTALGRVDEQVAEKVKEERSRIIVEKAKKARRAMSVDLEQKERELANL